MQIVVKDKINPEEDIELIRKEGFQKDGPYHSLLSLKDGADNTIARSDFQFVIPFTVILTSKQHLKGPKFISKEHKSLKGGLAGTGKDLGPGYYDSHAKLIPMFKMGQSSIFASGTTRFQNNPL